MNKFRALTIFILLFVVCVGILPVYAADNSILVFDESFKFADGFKKVENWNRAIKIKGEACHITNNTQTAFERFERSFEVQSGKVSVQMTVKIDGLSDTHGITFISSFGKEIGQMYISQIDGNAKLIFKDASQQGSNVVVEAPGGIDFRNWTVINIELDLNNNKYTGWFETTRPDNLKSAKLFAVDKMNINKISFSARPNESGLLGYYLKNIKLLAEGISDGKIEQVQQNSNTESPQGLLSLPQGYSPIFEDVFNYPDSAKNISNWSTTLKIKDKAIHIANSGGGSTDNYSRYFTNDNNLTGKVYVDFTIKLKGVNAIHNIALYSNGSEVFASLYIDPILNRFTLKDGTAGSGTNVFVPFPTGTSVADWMKVRVELDFSKGNYTAYIGQEASKAVYAKMFIPNEKIKFNRVNFTARASLDGILGYYISGVRVERKDDNVIKVQKKAPFYDVEDAILKNAVSRLDAFNIIKPYDNGSFKPDETVTRADFAKILVNMLGMHATSLKNTEFSKFDDVSPRSPGNGYITFITNLGILCGYDNNHFGPDDVITYTDSIKAIVNLLGYGVIAEQKGGYPNGYTTVASQIGITKGIKLSYLEKATRGNIALIVWNALEVDLMDKVAYGQNDTYLTQKGTTLLNKTLNIYKHKGVMTDNGRVALYGTSTLGSGKVAIDDKIYSVGNLKLEEYFGYTINAYYKHENNADDTLLYVEVVQDSNQTVTIQLDKLSDASIQSRFVYTLENDKNSKEYELDLDRFTNIILNNQPETLTTSMVRQIAGKSGYIKAIDNNNDGKYEYVIIIYYDIYAVDSVDNVNHKITDKYSLKNETIDTDNTKLQLIKQNKLIDFSQINEWDIVSIAKSANCQVIQAIVTSSKINGMIEQMGSDFIVVEGNSYKYAYNLVQYFETNPDEKPKLNDNCTFYLDVEGKIAAVNIISDVLYGYLYETAATSGVDKKIQFQIFDSVGQWSVLCLNNKVRFNGGATLITADEVYQNNLIRTSSGATRQQLISYKINDKGLITDLRTAPMPTIVPTGSPSPSPTPISTPSSDTTGLIVKGTTLTNPVYRSACQALVITNVDMIYVDESTLIIIVPSSNLKSDFAIKKTGYFTADTTYQGTATAYDVDAQTLIPKVIIIHPPAATDNVSTDTITANAMVFDHIASEINSEGNAQKKLYGYNLKELKSVFVADATNGLDTLMRGDLIQLRYNSAGEANGINTLYGATERANLQKSSVRTTYGDRFMLAGIVSEVDSRTGAFCIQDSIGSKRLKISTSSDIVIFNERSNMLSVGTLADLSKGSFVYMNIKSSAVQEVVVYVKK